MPEPLARRAGAALVAAALLLPAAGCAPPAEVGVGYTAAARAAMDALHISAVPGSRAARLAAGAGADP